MSLQTGKNKQAPKRYRVLGERTFAGFGSGLAQDKGLVTSFVTWRTTKLKRLSSCFMWKPNDALQARFLCRHVGDRMQYPGVNIFIFETLDN